MENNETTPQQTINEKLAKCLWCGQLLITDDAIKIQRGKDVYYAHRTLACYGNLNTR